MKKLFIILLPFLFTGCATLSENECRVANWQTIGYNDGSQGYATSRISEHTSACADYGVRPDLTLYLRGHEEGARAYCTPHNGFDAGRANKAYAGICSQSQEPSFMQGYRDGQKVYSAEQELNNIRHRITTLENDKKKLQKDIDQNQTKIISNETGMSERANLLYQNNKLLDRQSHIDHEIGMLKQKEQFQQNEIRHLMRLGGRY
ncbi:DUF2799 domain-containing protein [Algicola sagamiensis]|uniref:DUF2799 domain-containing protein n=1 Tax=Algicola sagamiensis TaxID=163869 RepID=UPI00035D9BB8|nr:DUF2799 domain-containing protein [Algicola sagamiensis]